jgi:alpha-L-arabinofuranosidase
MIHRLFLPLTLLLSLVPTLFAAAIPAPKGKRAVFDITHTVVQANPPRFGANIDPDAMSHWNTEPWHNQWWLGPNPNPVTARLKGTATGGSDLTLTDEGKEGKGARLGYFDLFRDGFFDGGTAVVYRFTDNKITLVREGKIARYQASADGPNRLTFAESGPAVQAGDEYVLTVVRTEFPPTVTRSWGANPWWLYSGLSLPGGEEKKFWEAGVRTALVPDVPPGGGGAAFSLSVPAGYSGDRVSVGNWFLSAEKPDWPRLNPGKTYTLRLWLKQSGMKTGKVSVKIASLADAAFTVTSEWAEYTADFTGAPPKSPAERFDIGIEEPGTVLMDNITIVEKDGPPAYGFYPPVVDTLKRFRPSTLRLWVLQDNKSFGKALDDALGDPALSNLTFRETNGARTTTPVGLHQQLELCAQVGTDPWIITSTLFSAQEQKNLIEYLAGPATSPYGQKRAVWGRPAPWTDTFQHIKIEMGNETWNPSFSPQGFAGRGAVYGAYSEYMFQQMKSSRWFKPGHFQFVLNGWVAQTKDDKRAFGASALRNSPSAQAIDIAYYTGGWDSVGLMKADNDAESWMNILTFSRRMLAPRAREFKETADKIAALQGRPGAVQSLVYEAGPGYTLPGPGKFNDKEQQEGKSLAHAINALDIFMSNLREGYGDQSFFMFKNGHYWSSHNRTWGEHIAWKALGMRNALLTGDMITAKAREMVTLDLPETQADVVSQSNSADKKVKSFPPVPDLPLIDCYPFRDGKRYGFMFISRRLDGPTEINLKLPYTPKSAYTLHALMGDHPGLHNIEEEVVKIQTHQREGMTKDFTFQMPKHSVVVLLNEAE